MKYPLVFVVWEDAASGDDWREIEDVLGDSCHIVHSVGFLIDNNPHHITLALTHDTTSGLIASTMFIPAGMVRELTYFPELVAHSL